MLKFLIIVLIIFFIFIAMFCIAADVKIDWTKEKELLLWYTDTENDKKVRKFITLIKF